MEAVSTVKSISQSEAEAIKFQGIASENPEELLRMNSGFAEWDRVCGGGLASGSVTLVSGDPGIGKSTLLLQIASDLSAKIPAFYISGEEGESQIQMRAKRLGLEKSTLQLASSTNLSSVIDCLSRVASISDKRGIPAFVVIDSIQTMTCSLSDSSAGTLAQVRECTQQLVNFAKATGVAVMIVGHITKEGMVAGPKVLEHSVDTVLYFEGDKRSPYRILRAIKNRFGPTDEIGVFDMTENGLQEISNPSALFITNRQDSVTGACVFAGIEGTRPILMEIQALSVNSFLPSPRRTVVGWDSGRLSMVLAVLEARCKINFSQKDVFLSVIGGMRISEPAADLCVAFALLSCIKKKPILKDSIAFGEIGLTGEIRPVSQTEQRLKEAQKMGFSKVFMPSSKNKHSGIDIEVHSVDNVMQLLALFD